MSAARAASSRAPALGVVLGVLFGLVATAIAAAAFWPTYRTGAFVLMAVVTIVLGVAIAAIGAVLRLSTAVVVVIAVAVFLIAGVPLAVPSEAIAGVLPSGQGMLDLLGAVALGWKQLITISVPVGSYAALLVPAFVATLATAVTTTTIALRAPRRAFAVLPPMVLFVAAIVLGPGTPDAAVPIALALVVVLVGWLMVVRAAGNRAALRELSDGPVVEHGSRLRVARGGVAALGVLVAAAVLGGAAAVALPATATRQVARTAVQPPFDPRDYPSPLSAFRSYLEAPKASEPMLTVTGLGRERRVNIATLDAYDGVVYGVSSDGSGSFARMPYRIDQPGGGARVSLSITVDGYSGVWVPSVGMLGQMQFSGPRAAALNDGFFYNDVTGTAAVLGGVRSGDTYRVDAEAGPVRSIASLTDARPGDARMPAVGVMPDGVKDAIQRYATSDTAPGAELAAALSGLVANGYISHGIGAKEPISRSGHGADRITELLTAVPMIGDQEQYAVAAALMARQLGFPARVVLGFVVPEGESTAGAVSFTGADISAWIQVQTAADGWVTVDPNPPVRPVPQKKPDDPTQVSRPQSVIPPPPADPQQDLSQPPAPHVASDKPHVQPVWLTVLLIVAQALGWLLLVALIVSAPFLAVIAAKWRRRVRRRSAPTATERITAGWHEFADSALDHGYRPPPSATRSEVAQTVGGMRPRVLAAVADRAVFGPAAPSGGDADQVWHAVDDLREALDSGKTRWQRFRAAVSLSSLSGYRERERAGRESR